MAVLLCTFASPRSTPEKIERWIAYLEEQRAKHGDDPQAVHTIDRLLHKAERWSRLEN